MGGARRPHVMSRDSVLAMFLLKLRYDTPFRKLGVEFGVPHSQLNKMFNELLRFVYARTGPAGQPTWLHRNQNLGVEENLRQFYEEIHHSTMMNERAARLLMGPPAQAAGQPAPRVPPDMRLVVLEWDSRPILLNKNQDHFAQRRCWCTKESI